MGDYRSWCEFCGESTTFGECGCQEAEKRRIEIEARYRKDKEEKRLAQYRAKMYLASLGWNVPQVYNFDKNAFSHDKEDWAKDDRHLQASYIDIADFISNLLKDK